MNCPLCGAINPEESDLCKNCGKPIPLKDSDFFNDELASRIGQIAQHNFRQGNFHQAINDISEYIEIDDGDPAAYIFRGKLYDVLSYESNLNRREVGKILTQSIDDFSHAIFLSPNNTIAFYNRGNAFLARKDFDFALDDFSRVINLSSDVDPNKAMSYSLRGFAYENLGDLDQAMIEYEKALRIDPGNNFTLLLKEEFLRRSIKSEGRNKMFFLCVGILILMLSFFFLMVKSA